MLSSVCPVGEMHRRSKSKPSGFRRRVLINVPMTVWFRHCRCVATARQPAQLVSLCRHRTHASDTIGHGTVLRSET
jgi:hypothetical protein